MEWSATAMKKLTASFLLACGLIGCSGDTKAPEEARHYDFSMENGTLEMKDGVHLAVTLGSGIPFGRCVFIGMMDDD